MTPAVKKIDGDQTSIFSIQSPIPLIQTSHPTNFFFKNPIFYQIKPILSPIIFIQSAIIVILFPIFYLLLSNSEPQTSIKTLEIPIFSIFIKEMSIEPKIRLI